ncbi:hypothetical protein PPERSA_03085 [Pseudocohnilembus persalinus]|uniref:Uncharacterized protein n=1 Tax=Pseudocohnilembus persalinus TaxID=266149 RepID=A0A0V0QL84_PSEPJ|nr:hypothetical protein PPERSA_03085 [Pseudocohnilembus persalinus]|eukprot:KRX02994.1 hypothetical protein PPERSA_03085 [Pseudocohnilembus persalinus]
MQNKNHPPKPQKQGGLYSLNLGQNNGPFLTKDIMLTNEKSLGLLRTKDNVAKYASQILQPNNNNYNNYSSLESYGQMSLGHRGGALEINQPQDYYDAKHKTYLNYDERYKAKQNAAENLASNTGFAELQKGFRDDA